MKIFNDGEFACPKHIIESGIDGNGQQYITICLKCRLDDRDICCGDKVVCENNHKNNKYSIALYSGNYYIKNLKRGKEETLTVAELLKIQDTLKQKTIAKLTKQQTERGG